MRPPFRVVLATLIALSPALATAQVMAPVAVRQLSQTSSNHQPPPPSDREIRPAGFQPDGAGINGCPFWKLGVGAAGGALIGAIAGSIVYRAANFLSEERSLSYRDPMLVGGSAGAVGIVVVALRNGEKC